MQEERNTRTEEEASLRGNIKALQAQLASAGTANQQAAEARQQANDDASRLRSELERATAHRDQLQADLAQLQNELNRYGLLIADSFCLCSTVYQMQCESLRYPADNYRNKSSLCNSM